MTEKQDMVVVTQSDREAAVDIYNVILHDWHTQHMLDGMEDECYVIQALKKHRLASQAGEGEAYPSLELCVQFTDDGQHIRKWSRLPFDGGECLYSHPAPKADAPSQSVEALMEAVQRAHDTLIELNPNNYSHDEVCAANEAAIEAILLLAEPLGERHGKSEEWWHTRRAALSTGQQKGPSQ